MVDVKNINKLITYYICEIIIVITFVGISVPFWQKINKTEISKIAGMYDTMDYLHLNVDKYVDNFGFEDDVAVINDTNTKRNYTLLLKTEKNVSCENININEETKLLNDIKYKEDSSYKYYLIDEGQLVASKNNFKVSFQDCNINYDDVLYDIIENKEI